MVTPPSPKASSLAPNCGYQLRDQHSQPTQPESRRPPPKPSRAHSGPVGSSTRSAAPRPAPIRRDHTVVRRATGALGTREGRGH